MKKDEAIKRVNEGELISLIYYFCHLQHMFKSNSWTYGVLLRKWFKYSNVVSKEIAILPNYNWSVTTHDECRYSDPNLDSPFQKSKVDDLEGVILTMYRIITPQNCDFSISDKGCLD